MIGLVEQFAAQIRWTIATTTVVVEGTSDVLYFQKAADLYAQQHGRDILDSEFGVVAAGERDDGGVDGINRRLNTARQLADSDRDSSGRLKHHFIGLFDNDAAGRTALQIACRFDRRLVAYQDLFLLHPVMPIRGNATATNQNIVIQANRKFSGLDWEVEDLCSQGLLQQFENSYPAAIRRRHEIAGRIHREFTRSAKPELRRFFMQNAELKDVHEIVLLVKALRSYRHLPHDFIGGL